MKLAKIYLYFNNVALKIDNKSEEIELNKILVSNRTSKFSPCLDDYDNPYPYYVIPYDSGEELVLLHTKDEHNDDNMGARDLCGDIISLGMLEKELNS